MSARGAPYGSSSCCRDAAKPATDRWEQPTGNPEARGDNAHRQGAKSERRLHGLTADDAARITTAISAAPAESTRTVYALAWRVWERWGAARGLAPLPGDPAALCAYLTERAADGIAVKSLDLACTAIGHIHRMQGFEEPVADETVRQVRLGLRRTCGVAPRRQARPLTVAEIRQIVTGIDRTTLIGSATPR